MDLSDAAFPFRAAREIDLGFALAWCTRITYVGELGYELFVPTEMAVAAYDEIVASGAAFGLAHCGLKALGSLRLEKAYRDYGHDIDNTDDPLEAGLGFAVAWDKPGGFLGREALLARRAAGAPTRRLVQVLLADPEPMMIHAEVLRRDGVEVGYLRSASYGFTLGGAVGLAMVDVRRSTRRGRRRLPGLRRVDGPGGQRDRAGPGVAGPCTTPAASGSAADPVEPVDVVDPIDRIDYQVWGMGPATVWGSTSSRALAQGQGEGAVGPRLAGRNLHGGPRAVVEQDDDLRAAGVVRRVDRPHALERQHGDRRPAESLTTTCVLVASTWTGAAAPDHATGPNVRGGSPARIS